MANEPTCRGSIMLGTACGRCAKCSEEEMRLTNALTKFKAARSPDDVIAAIPKMVGQVELEGGYWISFGETGLAIVSHMCLDCGVVLHTVQLGMAAGDKFQSLAPFGAGVLLFGNYRTYAVFINSDIIRSGLGSHAENIRAAVNSAIIHTNLLPALGTQFNFKPPAASMAQRMAVDGNKVN